MNVQETSLKAFHEDVQPTLGERQKAVYEALLTNHENPMTNNEIAAFLGWPINCVTPRVFELRKYKKVEEAERRKCKVSGRTAIAWRVILVPVQLGLL